MQRDADHVPFIESGSYPIRGGNAVRPLVDGDPAFRRICDAVERAEHSVWATIAFHHDDFEMPGEHGSLFDVLDRARARGVDVRVIFWRHLELAKFAPGQHFAGSDEDRAMLAQRGSTWLARWDQAHGRYCQHQKSWIVDAGGPNEVAFVGGINLNPSSVSVPGHPPVRDDAHGNTHDVYVEVRGPAATDVHHNFVQRWNEASDRDEHDGLWPDASSQDDLSFPERVTPEAGDVPVQIQRTVRRGRYSDGRPTPGGQSFAIEDGEFGIIDQYLRAIESARSSIYIEDQAIGSMEIVEALHAACERGVEVVFLLPIDPNTEQAQARGSADAQDYWDSLHRLGKRPNFTLAGIAANRGPGEYRHIYVHAKIALIDDGWCTIGSANIGNRSFYGDTELNATFWHEPTVRTLRRDLLHEHLDRDTAHLDDAAALRLYREIAHKNAARRESGEPLEGLALWLDAETYAT